MTQKYEREIEEILRNLGEPLPEEPLSQRVSRRTSDWSARLSAYIGDWRRYLTVQWFMVASIALVMLAFVLRVFSPRVAGYLNMLGLMLFVAAIVMSLLHWGGGRRVYGWRGRVIELSDRDGWWRSLQRRWRLWWRSRGW